MLANFLSLSILLVGLQPLEAVREKFKNKSSFEVNFTQEVQQEMFDIQQSKASGVLKFKKPHFLRWIYQEPKAERKEISFDGKLIKIKRESEEEIVQEPGEFSLEDSFSFLWGESKRSLFKIENLSSTDFVLKPQNRDQAQFQSIRVKIKNGLVQEAWIEDLLGGKNKISFQNWRFESNSKN